MERKSRRKPPRVKRNAIKPKQDYRGRPETQIWFKTLEYLGYKVDLQYLEITEEYLVSIYSPPFQGTDEIGENLLSEFILDQPFFGRDWGVGNTARKYIREFLAQREKTLLDYCNQFQVDPKTITKEQLDAFKFLKKKGFYSS